MMYLAAAAAAVSAVLAASAPDASRISQSATEKPGQVGVIVTGLKDSSKAASGVLKTLKDKKIPAVVALSPKSKNKKTAKAAGKSKRVSVALQFPVDDADDIAEMSDEKIAKKLKAGLKTLKSRGAKAKYVLFPSIGDAKLAVRVADLAKAQGVVAVSSSKTLHRSAKVAKKSLKRLLKKPALNGYTVKIDGKSKKFDDIADQLKASLAKYKKAARKHHSKKNRKYFKIVDFKKAVHPLKGGKASSASASVSAKSGEEVPLVREATRVVLKKHGKYVGIVPKSAKKDGKEKVDPAAAPTALTTETEVKKESSAVRSAASLLAVVLAAAVVLL